MSGYLQEEPDPKPTLQNRTPKCSFRCRLGSGSVEQKGKAIHPRQEMGLRLRRSNVCGQLGNSGATAGWPSLSMGWLILEAPGDLGMVVGTRLYMLGIHWQQGSSYSPTHLWGLRLVIVTEKMKSTPMGWLATLLWVKLDRTVCWYFLGNRRHATGHYSQLCSASTTIHLQRQVVYSTGCFV